MQFVDIPSGDLNMIRYVSCSFTRLPATLLPGHGPQDRPLVVEAESAYRDLDATSANGIQFVRDNLCFPLAAVPSKKEWERNQVQVSLKTSVATAAGRFL